MYKNFKAEEIVWAQKEYINFGTWSHLLLHLPSTMSFRAVSLRFWFKYLGISAS